jgi:hypothetical protein
MTGTIATTKRPGRPFKFDAKTRKRLIDAIAAGVPVCHACAACRVSKSGFHDYKNSHPRFAEAIERATGKAIEKHLRLIIKAAENGSTADSRWFLERVHPQHFGRTKLEISGADGEPLPGTQIAVLVWPHQQAQAATPLPPQNANHPSITAPDAN